MSTRETIAAFTVAVGIAGGIGGIAVAAEHTPAAVGTLDPATLPCIPNLGDKPQIVPTIQPGCEDFADEFLNKDTGQGFYEPDVTTFEGVHTIVPFRTQVSIDSRYAAGGAGGSLLASSVSLLGASLFMRRQSRSNAQESVAGASDDPSAQEKTRTIGHHAVSSASLK